MTVIVDPELCITTPSGLTASGDNIVEGYRQSLGENFPVFGGKTVRVRAGVEMAYQDNRPVVKLRGVSLMGVPIPNAWLGNMKNVDLVKEFSGDQGF